VPRFGTVLFDLDGTVVDTRELIRQSHRHAVTTVLGRDMPDDELLANVGRPLVEQMQAFDGERADELLHAQREWNHAHTAELIRPYPGIDQLLARLKAAGCSTGVVTSKAGPTVQLAFDALPDVARHIDVLVAVEDTPVHKPGPEPVRKGLQLLGARPDDACYVGDAPFDIAAGRAAGVTTVGVTWGFFPAGAIADANVLFDDVPALGEYLLPGTVPTPGTVPVTGESR
jgi:pyrophosphatase PpaX